MTTEEAQTNPGLIERMEDPSEVSLEKAIDKEEEAKDQLAHSIAAGSSRDIKIRFGWIHIRTYPTIIGDNPSPSLGPPLQMDWKPAEQIVVSVEEFEKNRAPRQERLLLTSRTRIDFLKSLGFSQAEIDEAIQTKRETRIHRQETVHGLRWAWKEEKQEERREYIRRVFFCHPEKTLDYPEERSKKRDPYWDEKHKVKPMFENIPCIHCASHAAHGIATDLPGVVHFFRCDGKQCKQLDGRVCPFNGELFTDLIKEASAEA